MDRLIELQNGASYKDIEKEEIKIKSVDEAKRLVFNNKIDDIFSDIDCVDEINKEIEKMTINHQYHIESQISKTRSLFIKLIARVKDVNLKADCQYQINMVNTCKKKLADVSKSNDEIVKKNIKSHRSHFKKFNPTLDDSKIDTMISNGKNVEDVIMVQIESGVSYQEVNLLTGKVNDKYNGTIALEVNVASLNRLFMDLMIITETQSEMLDNISLSIEHSNEFIEQGNNDLVKSIDYWKSIRGTQCLMFIIVLVITIIIITVCVVIIKS